MLQIQQSDKTQGSALDFELSKIGLWTWNVTEDCITWDNNFEKLFGLDPKSHPRRFCDFLAIVHPDDRDDVDRGFLQAAEKHARCNCSIRIVRSDGTIHRVVFLGIAHQDREREPLRMMGIYWKASDHSHAAEIFRVAVEAASHAMIIINKEGKIELVNAETEDLFGYSRDELVGESIEMLVPERYHGSHSEDRKTFIEDPKARPMGGGRDLLGRRKDGVEVPVEIGLKPMVTDAGMFVAASLINNSERIRIIKELRRTTSDLERSNAELEEFAYVASHDLQEPLRAIEGCAQLLRERYLDKLGSLGDKLITHTVEGVVRMQALIDDLLTFSRLETRGNLFEHTDCSAVLELVLSNLSAAVEKTKAVITHDAMPNILADETQLIQLFQNLISNALKFCGDRNPRIHIAAISKRNEWFFSVQDNGIGIDPQHFERIFHVFQRLHTRREYPGTGIGLAVCKKIVQRHGGRIWVESEPTKGSIFYFTIPKHPDSGQMKFEF